jgi:hypothetical protein
MNSVNNSHSKQSLLFGDISDLDAYDDIKLFSDKKEENKL